jgi:phenylalanyl-tRNA synthetase alpha chain
MNKEKTNNIAESLSPNERAIFSYLNENMEKIVERTKLPYEAVLRALEFLSNKKIIELEIKARKIIELGVNGVLYKQKGLPERMLLNLLSQKNSLTLEEAKKISELSDNEFKASLGALKKRAMINLLNGKMILAAPQEEVIKKTLEEKFIDALPIELEKLEPEQKFAFEILKNRKNIIEINNKQEINFSLTKIGKEIFSKKSEIASSKDFIETLTSEMISSGSWKGRTFRRYDISSPVPKISGGKRHFVNQAVEQARKIWAELGFKEMTGNMVQTGFWNFDALFTAQDHPVREIQDTFYIKNIKAKLPDAKIVSAVKESHENGIAGSKGWGGKWNEEEAKKVVLRTHTTCLSSQTLASLAKLKDKKGKYFAIGKCFRNETIDWGHGFEFNQTEGIVIDKNANFKNLLGYLKEFYKKMGIDMLKFVPSYFPYTEPSVEIYAYNSMKKKWIEVGGAGIFRPEVTIPLLGEHIPILAWGPGFDRILMEYYQIEDLREFYKNDINKLRKIKFWMR